MKKIIAGAALVTTLLGTGSAAFAETTGTTTTTPTTQTTTTTAPTSTTSPTTTTTTAPTTTSTTDTTTTTAPTTTTTDTTSTTTTAPTTTTQTGTEVTTTTDTQLPQVTLTPDKLFYSFKLWIENIKLAITRDAAEKAALLEQQAQTRLAEAKAMADAGKADLAQQAMTEAQVKLAEAQKQIEAAASTNKDLSKLTAQIDANQVAFTATLSTIMQKAPDSVKAQVEPIIADLMVQIAANQDAANKDEDAKEEAEKVADAAKLQAKVEAINPRTVLVLNAMAKASGKSLADVVAMYQANPGLGRIAKSLGLKMGVVQHAAQVDWKKGGVIQLEIQPATTAQATTTQAPATTGTQAPTTTSTDAAAQTQAQAGAQVATQPVTQVFSIPLNLGHGKGQEKKAEHANGNSDKAKEHGNSGKSGH